MKTLEIKREPRNGTGITKREKERFDITHMRIEERERQRGAAAGGEAFIFNGHADGLRRIRVK